MLLKAFVESGERITKKAFLEKYPLAKVRYQRLLNLAMRSLFTALIFF